jgi:hypothetical protein
MIKSEQLGSPIPLDFDDKDKERYRKCNVGIAKVPFNDESNHQKRGNEL